MAYATYYNNDVYNFCGEKVHPALLGSFRCEKYGPTFEYSERLDNEYLPEYPHLIYVSDKSDLPCGMSPYRYGLVKKTVVHIVVDEDENGPVIEKWKTRPWENRKYKKPIGYGKWEN